MTLKPDVQKFLAGPAGDLRFPIGDGAAAESEWLVRLRNAPRPPREPEPVGREWEDTVRVGVRVRIYVPSGTGPHPLLVYLHGGGWVTGDLEMHDPTCRRLCNRARCTVVNVDYRLAPEHPFPAPFEDAYASVLWAREHAAEMDADPSLLVVAGSSAGANLAAAVALRARDEGDLAIALQLLIYPVMDPRETTVSYRDNGSGYFLDRPQMTFFWDQYVPNTADRSNPYVAPARAQTLGDLPAAIIVTAEYDPLRDEGEDYAARMVADGGEAQVRRYDGQIHGFLGMLGLLEDAEPALDEIADLLRDQLDSAHAEPS